MGAGAPAERAGRNDLSRRDGRTAQNEVISGLERSGRTHGEVVLDAGARRYWAFISYSHRDAKVAAALQHALETYRLPRRLVGRTTVHGAVPEHLKPVFRDRDELRADSDLGATVRDALAQSRNLIVVCSPDAARSAWVEREIVEFKKLHGEAHVLAVIAAGEPFASRVEGRTADECFPAALRFALATDGTGRGEPREPVAADLRPQGDGRRLATLKLVAGMLGAGVGLDELVRRDAQRRVKRMAAVAAASFAGMAAMAVLTVMAVQSRAEAQSQRAQAEDLVEFMLGDLRKRLDPVGRLDVLDAVGEKALAYYGRQDPERLDANALGRRSRAMHLIGEMREQRGQLDAALAAFRSAADTTGQLLALAPDDGARIFDHAQSVYWVGYIAWRRGQADIAESAFLQYRDLAQRLVRIDAANVDWQLETAYAAQNLGVIQLEHGRLADALASFTATRDAMARVAGVRPAVAFELSDAYGWIAKTHEARGDYANAIVAQQARLETLRAVPDADKDSRVRSHRGNARYELARLELYRGDLAAAMVDANAAIVQADALVAADGENLQRRSDACFDRLRLAEIALAQGDRATARAVLARVSADATRLMGSDASMMIWQINLDGLLLTRTTALTIADGGEAPAERLDAYLAKIRELEGSGHALTTAQAEIVAGVEVLSGEARLRAGRRDDARERFASAAARLAPQSAGSNYPVLTSLARARWRLDDQAEARALAARVEASQYRHPAYAELAVELHPGAGPGPAPSTTGRT